MFGGIPLKKIIVCSKFNIMTGERNKAYSRNEIQRFSREWIEYRMKIFMNFTCKSLKKQTNQDFTALYVYEDNTENLIEHELSKYPTLPPNIKFIKKSQYTTIISSLTQGYDELYLTRLDSDDMYHKDFIQKLHDFNPKPQTQALLCQYGYIYDSVNNRLAEYYHSMFTYYTFIYRFNDETDKFSNLNVTPWDLLVNFSHAEIIKYNYEPIPDRNFLFNIHSLNTDSFYAIYDWGFCRVEREIHDAIEIKKIIKNFF